MGNNLAVNHAYDSDEISEISAISTLLIDADSPTSAFVRFAEFLEFRGFRLLLIASCDSDQLSEPRNLYTNISESLETMCEQANSGRGCPIVQKAMLNRTPYEALGADYSMCKEFSSKRYLGELNRLGHQEIAVVPIRINKIFYITVIGLNDRLFRGSTRDRLLSISGQFATGLYVKFPEIGKSGFAKTRVSSEGYTASDFSTREREAIFLSASGMSNLEIGKIFDLSELGVERYLTVACSKLGARNKTQAVAKAVKLGLFDIDDIY